MAIIQLETFIDAPIERVFDLARSIDLHKLSTKETNEKAISGRTEGLIQLNETVTWKARHLGIYQKLTVVVTEFDRPKLFVDKMVRGAFSAMEHTHQFEAVNNGTKMIDVFNFSSPFGFLGKIVDFLFLQNYMRKFLIRKNLELKLVAESNKWKTIIDEHEHNPSTSL